MDISDCFAFWVTTRKIIPFIYKKVFDSKQFIKFYLNFFSKKKVYLVYTYLLTNQGLKGAVVSWTCPLDGGSL